MRDSPFSVLPADPEVLAKLKAEEEERQKEALARQITTVSDLPPSKEGSLHVV